MFKTKKQEKFAYAVFGVYLVLLCWLILFKFSFSFDFFFMERRINLVPFSQPMIVNGKVSINEMLLNMLVFVPFGAYMHMLLQRRSFILKVLPVFGTSILLEALQFGLAIGACDITDVINNTLGGVAGIGLFALLQRMLKNKAVALVNLTGLTVEAAGTVILLLLLVNNL